MLALLAIKSAIGQASFLDTSLQNSNNQELVSPELCPEFIYEKAIYNPSFLMSVNHYKKRYQEVNLLTKIVDNKGNGFDSLYGTRNLRPVLHGVAYRGGANNYFHKTAKRKNTNPLAEDGLINLCREGFSSSVYLYKSNWDSSFNKTSCNCINNSTNQLDYFQLDYFDDAAIYTMLELVYKSALDKNIGPVYFHCWNGWHASGFIGAIVLKQFCGFSNLEAVNYWDLCTDGTNISPRYNTIRARIKAFEPYEDFVLSDSLGNAICPPMPKHIDSTQLHISLEHLSLVPEALPKGTILILENIKFQANKTSISIPAENKDLKLLLQILNQNKALELEISGHTDNSGKESNNKALSLKRAQFIGNFLIENQVSKNRLSFVGKGSSMPAYSNSTKVGRDANRRIEIKIITKQDEDYSLLVNEKKSLNLFSQLAQLNEGQKTILKTISFKPNQVQLNLKGVAALDSLSSFLIKSPEHCINIIGYTDASGVEEKNIILSNKRAHAVFLYLINKKVNQNQLYFTGCGSIDPLANNKYEWGRKKNRRIETELLKK